MANATNTLSKDILARLLAGENITVNHDATARTASFDTRNRVLTLPVWDNMTHEIYDMLVGHEVGHALFTPWTERDEAANGIAAAIDLGGNVNADIAMQYLNVVEDARIERLMKEKFPGLRRDFFEAYKSFNERDFFGIKDTNINDLPLIDRINIHFKCGTAAEMNIAFNAEEQAFVDRIAQAQTFDEVVAIATDVFTYAGHTREDADQEQQQVTVNMSPNGEGNGEPGEGAAAGQQGDQNGKSAASSGNNNDKGSEENSNDSGHRAGKKTHTTSPVASKTQRSFDESCRRNFEGKATTSSTTVMQRPVLENIILSPEKIAAEIAAFDNDSKWDSRYITKRSEFIANCGKELREFLTESNPTINMMAKQFEMRKAADVAKRTSVSKTGVIDTVRMMNYKMTDDIFRRNATIADGKNHGLVMFIDWSSSMGGVIENTVKQLIQLVMFCKKVNIPFEVYAFSSAVIIDDKKKVQGHYGDMVYDPREFWRGEKIGNAKPSELSPFTLINFLSSRLTKNKFNEALLNMWRITKAMSSWDNSSFYPNKFGLSSTPLDETVVAAMEIVPEFREKNRLQIVHTVFLTDGESSTGGFPSPGCKKYKSQSYIIDPVTKKMYNNTGNDYTYSTTPCLLQIFRDRTKSNAIGFFLMGNKTLVNKTPWFTKVSKHGNDLDMEEYTKQCDSYAKNGFAVCPAEHGGYNEQYIIRSTDKVSNGDALASLGDGAATATRVANALIKDGAARARSRIFLSRFIDLIVK